MTSASKASLFAAAGWPTAVVTAARAEVADGTVQVAPLTTDGVVVAAPSTIDGAMEEALQTIGGAVEAAGTVVARSNSSV